MGDDMGSCGGADSGGGYGSSCGGPDISSGGHDISSGGHDSSCGGHDSSYGGHDSSYGGHDSSHHHDYSHCDSSHNTHDCHTAVQDFFNDDAGSISNNKDKRNIDREAEVHQQDCCCTLI